MKEEACADYIIVGGGAAGSVLARRLSDNPNRHVLLIEAGRDMPPGGVPEKFLDSYPGAAYVDQEVLWKKLKVETESERNTNQRVRGRQKFYEQARVMGGGTTINGQFAHRGSPADFDEWHARGATGWGWDDVLPYFRKLEHDLDFRGPLHGQGGPMPIRRIFPESWTGHAKALAKALDASGLTYLPDQNGEYVDGYFPFTINNAYERRVSASTAYLDATARQRPNLRILTQTTVSQLLFEGRRCIGVVAHTGEVEQKHLGREVVLACGALHTPAILLRAGIGPASASSSLGIDIVADRPGVGTGLMDHPSIALASFVRREARVNQHTRRHMHVGWRYTSGPEGAPQDMYVVAATRTAWHAVGAQIGAMLLLVNKTFSDAGSVSLRSFDWRDEPKVQFRLLSDSRDLERLADGFLRLVALQASPAMAAITSDPFPAVFGEKMRQVSEKSHRNQVLTYLAAQLLDGSPKMRSWLMSSVVAGQYRLDQLLKDSQLLREFIRENVVGAWHPSSSCRMGSADDELAVTDPEGRVYGVEGLRVVDASIFPTVPRAALTLSVIMAAEKIADAMN
jgi:5-(hydroxymethyl)furfural/furfural oxidase